MEMTIREVLFMLSTAIALPVVAVLTFAYFSGGLKRNEEARFLPVREDDFDWWAGAEALPSGGDSGEAT